MLDNRLDGKYQTTDVENMNVQSTVALCSRVLG
jgi:hypothetical protein